MEFMDEVLFLLFIYFFQWRAHQLPLTKELIGVDLVEIQRIKDLNFFSLTKSKLV